MKFNLPVYHDYQATTWGAKKKGFHMLRYGYRAASFFLIATIGACGIARAASDGDAPLPGPTPAQPPVEQTPAVAADGPLTYPSFTSARASLASDAIPTGNDNNRSADSEGMGGDSMADDDGMGNGEHSHRVDMCSPAFVMFSHVLEAGNWQTGYRYSNTYMDGNRAGASNLSDQQALDFLGPGKMFMMVPTSMTMETHMLPIMRGVTDDVTAYVMPMWMVNMMDMVNRKGMITETANSGFGDLPFGALWRACKGENDELIFNVGFSAPTGNIDSINPMSMGMGAPSRYPYTMRLGHGTWDARPAVTYRYYWDRASFGLQGSFDLPMGLNDLGYQVGDEYRVNAWFAYLLDEDKRLALTFRMEGLWRNNYVGADPGLNLMAMPGNDPNMRGGDFMNFGYGAMYMLPHHLGRLDFEVVTPIVQNVQGVQPGFDWAFATRYLITF